MMRLCGNSVSFPGNFGVAPLTYAELLEGLWGLQIVDDLAHLSRQARPRR